MKKEQMAEVMRAELLAQPVLGTVISEIKKSSGCVSWVGLSGSKARGAELGTISDDDLVILLGENIDGGPLNIHRFDQVIEAVNRATEKLICQKGIIPVFASTIRLEDALIALAKLSNPTLPIHMVHLLVYPSVEAAVAFEPPFLTRDLFGKSLTLLGDRSFSRKAETMARYGGEVLDDNLTIGGLDLISDNFRMLLVNQHILPADFLGSQMIHVLDYLLKWKMSHEVERRWGAECGTWGEIMQWFTRIDGCWEIVALIKEIIEIRLNDSSNLGRVEEITRKVIERWPILTKIRMESV